MESIETYLNEYLGQIDWPFVGVVSGRIVLILVLACVAMAIIGAALKRLELRMQRKAERAGADPDEAAKRTNTLLALLRQAAFVAVWLMAGLMLLTQLGVSIAPILASAGILGLAIGFGAQNLVRDVISGFFVILENQIRVGDVATLNGVTGTVERINFRTTVLRDVSGTVHVTPNGTIATLANLSVDWSAYVADVGVAYKEDTDRVARIMSEVGAELRRDKTFGALMVADIELLGVNALADSAVIMRARLKTRPGRQWETGREYLRRVKKALDRASVEIPFPHRTLYFGEASPPVLTQRTDSAQTSSLNTPDS